MGFSRRKRSWPYMTASQHTQSVLNHAGLCMSVCDAGCKSVLKTMQACVWVSEFTVRSGLLILAMSCVWH